MAGREQWSSQWGFMLAAMGSAIGLANMWRFPYTAGVSGGGAFVLIYLGAVLTVALPLLMAELLVGRRGQATPTLSISRASAESGASRGWTLMGYGGLLAAVLVLAFYSVVGGWTLSYVAIAGSGGLQGQSAEALQALFDGLTASPGLMLLAYTAFLGITVALSSLGLQSGVERTVKLLMPALLVMLVGMVIYAAITGDFTRALAFLFVPDFSAVTPAIVLDAFGQAFFSISVGLTNLMAYGAYMSRSTSIVRSSAVIVGADTLVALLAGLAIFPVIFAHQLAPAGGPGLVFMSLPIVFGNVSGGLLLGTVFFLLLSFAALTSALCMLETPVSYLIDERHWRRRPATLAVGVVVWLLGLSCVLSFSYLAGVHPLGGLDYFQSMTFFDLFDFVVTRLLSPLIGACIALYVGWALARRVTAEELGLGQDTLPYRLWLLSVRFAVPAVLVGLCYSLLAG
ncbi:sodium-dependent transporter [Parahaliea mediterranea]|uniref:sodium-dependent transporter n=1 Tax=Parahaliea mediterranea TaxID=651086 RepID=UPI000E2F8F75|nr:sodium-dependent transporter [Parahaliea mediterranea]